MEFYTEERCFILESWNDVRDAAVSIARCRVKPGVVTQWHSLTGIAERYLVIRGEGLMEVGELAPTKVCEGAVVMIPAGVRQRVTNTGREDLIFYAICTPKFVPECYENLEE